MAVKPPSPKRPDPPRRLYFARQFEFTSALALQECAARLQAADQMPTGCFNPPIFVSVNPEANAVCSFYMSVETRVGKGWVIGNLQSRDGVSTQLSGKFGAGAEIILLAILLVIFAPIVVYAKLPKESTGVVVGFFLLFLALFTVIFWYNLYWARSKLFKILEQIVKA